MYSFEIPNIGELDLDRIIQENAEMGIHAVLIPSENSDLLLISNELLARFESGDNVLVMNNALQPVWGQSSVGIYHKGRKIAFHSTYDRATVTLGRAARISPTNREQIVREIQAAINYERKIKVEVLQLHSKATFT